MSRYLLLCIEFAKISIFAIGGGLASLPFLYSLSDRYAWFSHGDLADMVAVSESTPGPIGINMATYVGYTVAGVLGGVLATVSYIIPSILIGVIVARFLEKFKASPYVEAVFYGIRPAVCGLIGAAAYKIMSISLLDLDAYRISGSASLTGLFRLPAILMFGVMTVMNHKLKWHPVVYIAIAAVIGVLLKF
ncbi:MAG: chromate transporter [Clostridiales bacterium]|nr:chromate transporter [Clostridiales bacterium]